MATDGVRAKVSIGLAEALAGDEVPSEEDGLALAALADEIERAMFAAFQGTSKDYKSKYRTLLFNLKDEKNPTLRMRVRKRELSIETLITADAKALASEQLQAARQEMQERYFATRQQVDGEMLVGWQAGTKGSLSTHKNTDVNKLGSTLAAAAEESRGVASPLRDAFDAFIADEAAPSTEREGTPVPMDDNGTPLHDGGTPLHDGGYATGALDDDIWGVNEEDTPLHEPPAKARKVGFAEVAARAPAPPLGPPPPLRPPPVVPAPKRAPAPAAIATPPAPPPPPVVKAALRGTEWLLPTDAQQVIADEQLLRERIQRAYAVRARVCGQPAERAA